MENGSITEIYCHTSWYFDEHQEIDVQWILIMGHKIHFYHTAVSKFCLYCAVKIKIFSNSIYIASKSATALPESFNNISHCFDSATSLKIKLAGVK